MFQTIKLFKHEKVYSNAYSMYFNIRDEFECAGRFQKQSKIGGLGWGELFQCLG